MAATSTNLSLILDFLGLGLAANKLKSNFTAIDTAIGTVLTGSKTYDAASLVDGAGASTTVTVTGAALGDFVTGISMGVDLQGIRVTGYVSAADTVTVRFQNESGGTLDLASTTLKVRVRKA